ncbi:MAG: hypothetical protein CL569_08175 [Alphaproteobacteria bacterium]|nr:hypothetical protein [Alphaproteobacteria bacterium]
MPNLAEDERFRELPFIASDPFLKFYAGMPLINPEDYALGTLCIMDSEPRDLAFQQVESIRRLARQAVGQLELRRSLVQMANAQQQLSEEKEKAEALLLNILPSETARELDESGKVEPRHYPSVTTMFADFKNFTQFSESMEPRVLVDDFHQYFFAFDEIVARNRLEKLKPLVTPTCLRGGSAGSEHDPRR